MSDDGRDETVPTVTRTVCPRCQGQSASVLPVAAEDGSRTVPRPCVTCAATGRLPGFQIPV